MTADLALIRYLTGNALATLAANNDNWRLLEEWMTPAEFTQWIERKKERLKKRLAADFRLRSCPDFQLDWAIAIAMERCAAWHVFGIRE